MSSKENEKMAGHTLPLPSDWPAHFFLSASWEREKKWGGPDFLHSSQRQKDLHPFLYGCYVTGMKLRLSFTDFAHFNRSLSCSLVESGAEGVNCNS